MLVKQNLVHSFYERIILVVALSVLGGYLGWHLYSSHRRIEIQEGERLAAQAKIIDQNLALQLVAVDNALTSIRSDLPDLTVPREDGPRINHHLKSLHAAIPGARGLVVLNDQGVVVAGDRAELIGQNFRDRKYFEVARRGADPDVLYVSAPFKAYLGSVAISLARVIPDAQGRFAGIVLAIIDPVFSSTLMESVRYAPDMWSGLIHGDGKLFVTVPELNAAGQDLAKPGSPFSLFIESGQSANVLTGKILLGDKDERMLAQRSFRPADLPMDRPLVISVSRNLSAVFAEWRQGAYRQGGLFGLLALIAGTALTVHQRRQSAFVGILALHEAKNKHAVDALRTSEDKYSIFFDNSRVGTMELAIDGRIINANDRFCRFIGYDKEELSRLTPIDFLSPEDRPTAKAALAAYLSGQDPDFHVERRYIRGDGKIVWAQVTATLVRDLDGNPRSSIGIVEDITERKQAEQLLRAAKLEADRANAAKSRFLAAASHDLRQPVQSLLLLLAAIEDEVGTQPTVAKTVGMMKSAVDSINGLLSSTLDISRLDAGVVAPVMQCVDLSLLVGKLTDEYVPVASAKGVAIRVVLRPLHARTDPALLQRLLRNLIENAVRYTAKGGILVGLRQRGERVRIDVVDTGIGIPADQRAEVFEEFYQVDNPGRDRSQGLGLGLAIVARLGSLLEGEVELASRIGRGSRFSVLLPGDRAAHPAVASPVKAHEPEQGGGRILIIEDDVFLGQCLQIMLERWGYSVLAAASGENALALAAAEDWRFDAVIADHRLGHGLTGTATATEIERRAGRSIPTLVVSGDTAKERIAEVEASGYGMLHKPLDPDDLRRRLAQLLHQAESPSSASAPPRTDR